MEVALASFSTSIDSTSLGFRKFRIPCVPGSILASPPEA
ncbi:hypothetical protein EVA_10454 [gut metagenome]|uniref:Uncharacterized protein n=1 Tax=gut metagenome TaxID=749906 RepID=J9GNG1_9ZZZZ